MNLQVVSQSELQEVEGGNHLAAFHAITGLRVQSLAPGSTVELNPQPLPPGDVMIMQLQNFQMIKWA